MVILMEIINITNNDSNNLCTEGPAKGTLSHYACLEVI